MRILTLSESFRGFSIFLASNKTPSSPTYGTGIKIKLLPEEKIYDELPAGGGDDSSLSPLVVNGDLKIVNVSGGNGYINSHNLSQ